jgi:hypothetical protein
LLAARAKTSIGVSDTDIVEAFFSFKDVHRAKFDTKSAVKTLFGERDFELSHRVEES